MKKTILATCIGCLSILSCRNDFLNLAPISSVNTQNFYKTAGDIELAVNAAYSTLQLAGQFSQGYWVVGETRSDNTFNFEDGGNNDHVDLDLFRMASSNSILSLIWVDYYRGIMACNVVLERINGVTMENALKERYIGEVSFLRALMYFNLVRIFGDVPLVLTETKSVEEGYSQGRIAANEVYSQIIQDLQSAENKLPKTYSGALVGRATSGAAKAVLGKVYLTKKEYAAAQAKLKEVIDQGTYSLLTDYAALWNPANKNNAESVFEIQFKKGTTGTSSAFLSWFAPRNSGNSVTINGFAYGRNLPTEDLAKAYEANDLRKKSSLAEGYTNSSNVFVKDKYTLKFNDQPFTANNYDNNWPYLRYADVLLMYAEATNEVNGGPNQLAYDQINAVRKRAGLNPLPANLNKNTFALALEHERQVELAFEGHRWFDLVRTGRALEVMNAHFKGSVVLQSFQLLYPIPQSQIDINPDLIRQNPGHVL
ncbi:RagB/SusD family nutrient uptake outer membrane protein [Dyadobacter sp. CY323]|uniref:RagB/SusD family nutrient uptake outer membrane protein n=1 Tax=Dyadobacter sp. CY323 TaxID=2907302 RepID=UPI001F34FC58|nr:RagB/SusD family nutrient uptake outer membrane protein [Dyadobacter sp. CY323]MCE6989777.1 RagB/SusD family nutrient uptake outer membrane protein [Dyadobacter sp. CY323]